jgi:hypothetical protein
MFCSTDYSTDELIVGIVTNLRDNVMSSGNVVLRFETTQYSRSEILT